MSKLIESILDGDYVSANHLFEKRMIDIQEQKLHEVKRDMQAEVFGGLSPADIEARKKAGYRKAADVWGDPADKQKGRISDAKKRLMAAEKEKSKKKIAEDALDEAGLAPTAVGKVYRAGIHAAAAVKEPRAALKVAGRKVAGKLVGSEMGRDVLRGALKTQQRISHAADKVKKAPGELAQAVKQKVRSAIRDPLGAAGSGARAVGAGAKKIASASAPMVKKTVGKTVGTAGKMAGGAIGALPSMFEEERKAKFKSISRNISKDPNTILVKRKGAPGTLRISKDKYNPRIHGRFRNN